MTARAAAQVAAEPSAEALFDQGRKLMATQQYEEACPKFAASHRLDPALGTLLNLAYCWKQVGKVASAWTAYREAASLAHWQRQSERELFARAEAAELEGRLARLNIRVADADLPGLELRRNGVPVPPDVWGVEVPVDPGEYTIEAVAPDRSRFATKVTVQAASAAVVHVPVLEKRAAPSVPAAEPTAPPVVAPARTAPVAAPRNHAPPPPTAHARADTGSVLPALSIAVGAAGLVAFGVAGFFALRMEAQDAEARRICPDEEGPCSADEVLRHRDRQAAAHASRSAAYVGAGVGTACVIAAIALYVAAPAAADPGVARARTSSVTVGVARGEFTIVTGGRF
jgi:hypothetical protein